MARYIAASASAISVPAAVPAAPTATPTLALTRRRTPSTSNGCQEGAEHAGGDPGGVALVGDPLAEDGEPAAVAGHGVPRAQHLFQARARGAQDRVAGLMAERLVEDLQAVEVDAQQRDAPGAAAQAGERAGRAVLEQDAVREAGQRVAVQRAAGAAQDVRQRRQEVGLVGGELALGAQGQVVVDAHRAVEHLGGGRAGVLRQLIQRRALERERP